MPFSTIDFFVPAKAKKHGKGGEEGEAAESRHENLAVSNSFNFKLVFLLC